MTGGSDSPLPDDGDFSHLHASLLRDRGLSALLDAIWREQGDGGLYGSMFTDGAVLQIAATLLRMRDAKIPRPDQVLRGGLASGQ